MTATAPLRVRQRHMPVPAPLVAVAGLIAVSAGLRAWTAWHVLTPWINSDEITYSQLGRSLYLTGHLEILGQRVGFLSLVYPAIIGPALLLHDVGSGYTLLKIEQAVVMSLTAIPVYLWSRTLVRSWWAVTAAGLTLTIPGLAYSGLVMSEAAFYPAVVLAAWRMAAALARPSTRNQAFMLAAVGIAIATRLQAFVLVPAFATAFLIKAFLERDLVASIRRFLPTIAVAAVVFGGWVVYALTRGNGFAVLGGYQGLAATHLDAASAARFVAYHAADAVLIAAGVPACAAALVVLASRSGDAALHAYAAVASALAIWLVLEVGLFASRYVGHLAERNLLPLAPVLFVGFVVWLDRGLPRPRYATAAIVGGAAALLAYLPLAQLVTHALPDAFMLVPFARLQAAHPAAKLELVLVYLALPLLALFIFVPRRYAFALPLAVAALLVWASVSVSRAVIDQSRYVDAHAFGASKTWIDGNAHGRVAYLYAGEGDWGPVFENIFWNRRIRNVDAMPGPLVPGPLPQTEVRPTAEGVVTSATGAPLDERYLVAGASLLLDGTRVAEAPLPKLALWHVDGPPRLSAWLAGVDVASEYQRKGRLVVVGAMNETAELVFYGCRGGVLKLTLAAGEPTNVRVSRNGRLVRALRLAPGAPRTVVVEAQPLKTVAAVPDRYRPHSRAGELCDVGISTTGFVDLRPLEFVRR